jgi:hypothetical protein
MARYRLKLRELRKILRTYGVEEDPSAGKGSHTLFWKVIDGRKFTYPVPTTSKDVKPCYVLGCRKRFALTEDDGETDEEFFGRR